MTARRKPRRAGVLNVWEYDSQVFEFGDGRLALRGRNGSGKSNALSLLFPFVLDGVMSAQRMDPMGGARSMRSLLLCRDDDDPTSRFRYDSRIGYVWMEFDGGAGPLTIGIGATASAQRPDAHAWFFVTTRRVGIDLDLELEGRPRSQRELAAELDDGQVLTSAEEYRSVVDRELFGVGPVRYRKLVDLLMVLRRPHLAGKLDPDNVSGTLSAGLAALDPALITDVARSFDDLEATQQELHDVRTSLAVLERFLPVYVDHLVHHVRRRAAEVVRAHNELRRLRTERNTAEAERISTDETVRTLEAEIGELGRSIAGDDVEIEAILASPAYRAAGLIDEVGRAAAEARSHAEAAVVRAQTVADDAEAASGRAERAVEAVAHAETTRADAERAVRDHAVVGGLELGTEPLDPAVVRATAAARRNDLRNVRAALHAAMLAAQLASQRGDALATATTSFDEAVARVHAAGTHERAAHDELGAALADWTEVANAAIGQSIDAATLAASGRSSTPDRPLVAPRFDALVAIEELASGVGAALTLAADARVEPLRRAVGEVDAEAVDRHRRLDLDHIDLTSERQRVMVEPNPGPPASTTRPGAADTGRAGAPLYTCVEFRSDVPARDRAGWEAVLHAAGVLDARVFAEGGADDALDTTLRPRAADPGDSATLADLFVAVPCNGVGTDAIEVVLRSVPLDSDGLSVHADGRWRVGPVDGRFHKDTAEYIGHEARERRRAERVAELDLRIVAVNDDLASIDEFRRALDDVRSSVARVLDELPSTDDLERAIDGRRAAETAAHGAREALDHAAAEAERATAESQAADGAMRSLAVLHRLGTSEQALDAVDEALVETDRAANDLSMAIERHRDLQQAAEQAEADRARAASRVSDSEAEARALLADAADDQQRRLDTLRSEVGADAAAAQQRLAAARTRRQRTEGDREVRRGELSTAVITADRLGVEIVRLDEAHAVAHRRTALAGSELDAVRSPEVVEALHSAGVAAIDVAQADDPVATLRAARAALEALGDVEDGATDRMMQAYQQQLLDGLRAGHDPQLTNYDDVAVVRVNTVDGLVGVGRLVIGLRADADKLDSLLTERERQIFETHLLTRVSEALRDLLSSADEFEESINREMAAAPTESGIRVELKWELVTDRPRTKEAMALLRFSPEMLGPEQREQLRAFFAAGIAEARAADPGRSFADTLAEVLDYRAWHRFTLYARFGDGQRQQMTRAFFRGLSGGEAATVLHLPLFAAAAAHYITCDAAAPRLIALDEAFAGIDERMRGRLMGLLVSLDLDVLLTSHEFWGTYPEVPEIVVYDLMRRPPSPGVSAQQFTWRAGIAS